MIPNMRTLTDAAKVQALMQRLGRRARGSGRIYLVGGASAVLVGWRAATVDVDLKLAPEPPGIFEAIAQAKDTLRMNVELAAPDDFLPPLPGWQERSQFIVRHGEVDFFHYDFYGQALAKIGRGLEHDLRDVQLMARRGLIETGRLLELFSAIESDLIRYPQIDPGGLRERLRSTVRALGS